MITRNFKALESLQLEYLNVNRENFATPLIRVIDVYGRPLYVGSNGYLNINYEYTNYFNYDGVSFGSGSTPPTEEDCRLENHISSGLNVSRVAYKTLLKDHRPTIHLQFEVTNTSSSAITISEIGCKVLRSANFEPNPEALSGDAYGRATDAFAILIDRTVFENPVTLNPDDTETIIYELSTLSLNEPRIVNTVKMVPFETGTDEEIGAIIDAAHAGLIDLHDDAGWRVGDKRLITVSEFTPADGIARSYASATIVISSFEDYNNCGCVMQFDFANSLQGNYRLGPTGYTNDVTYGDLEMCTSTLPAMANALPAWLKNRLLTFDVLARNSNGVTTVHGNKLALRGYSEYMGSPAASEEGYEGPKLELFKLGPAAHQKTTRQLATGALTYSMSHQTGGTVLLRTFGIGGAYNQRAYVGTNTPVSITLNNGYLQSDDNSIAPFGCL